MLVSSKMYGNIRRITEGLHKGNVQIIESIQHTCRPVVKHMLGDVCGRVVWRESEVLCFAADQDKAKMHLKKTTNENISVRPNPELVASESNGVHTDAIFPIISVETLALPLTSSGMR